ncbi:class I SAM-dependent methyltransferase [Salisaeta longa]|uniref:class I SAM-dependent methyltransferase n=1 Tax=Salisaeta longa TaxID=503170 RepID=UPI0003B57018|nr:class I SAM-dependent methyltransferase [Salisaeta longa]
MSWYHKAFAHGLARGDDAQHRIYGARKRELLGPLRGTVVEIGPGTGLNFRYLSPNITWIGLEPNPHMHSFIRRAAAARGVSDLDLRPAPLETALLPDGTADAVVSTLVLCSVPDVDDALRRIHRWLRPGGRLVFIEHVIAPERTAQRLVQRGLRPCWSCLADGCHPDRDTAAALHRSPFAKVAIERFNAPLPVVRPHIAGHAIA